MARGEISFRVSKPPSEVFPYLADLENALEWVPDLLSMEKVSKGSIGIGTLYKETVRLGNRTSDAELEITEYEPDRIFAHRGKGGPSRFSGRFVLKPDGDGTLVTHQYTVRMTGLFKVMSPFVGRWVRRNTEAGIQSLKRALEK